MKPLTKILLTLPLILLALTICYPIWFSLTGAISSQWELEKNLEPVFYSSGAMAAWPLLPQSPTLSSLVEVLLDSPGFFPMFWNSVFISLFILLGQFLVTVPAAWSLARLPLPGKKPLLTLYTLLMLMPFQVLMFPQYLILRDLRLLDTLSSVILPAVFSTFPVFLLHRFFLAIPQEILEAARIDGAGEGRIFLQMALPLGAPGILATGILTFLESWNMIEQPMTYLTSKTHWPLALFLPSIGLNDMGMGFAASLITLIPPLLLFLLCQDDLKQGISASMEAK